MVAKLRSDVSVIDLFCGVGGLSYGLQQAGLPVVAGIDVDDRCKYPFEENIDAVFVEQDVATITAGQLKRMWRGRRYRVLAGCAPCQPFSSFRRGADTTHEDNWDMLSHFGRLVSQTRPDYVTMENVPRVVSSEVFQDFVRTLEKCKYHVSFRTCFGPEYGLAQNRRRLVLVAALGAPINAPTGSRTPATYRSVRDVIGKLSPVKHGETDPRDSMHTARKLTPINAERLAASKPGGTWRDWPEELRAPCHRKASGSSFQSVYARMEWDKPAPTITTQSFNFGTGRFGHPEQPDSAGVRDASGIPKEIQVCPA
jgi:DNA (cytosine-5)-methyltransferase 1